MLSLHPPGHHGPHGPAHLLQDALSDVDQLVGLAPQHACLKAALHRLSRKQLTLIKNEFFKRKFTGIEFHAKSIRQN